jgi:hypothetical protein
MLFEVLLLNLASVYVPAGDLTSKPEKDTLVGADGKETLLNPAAACCA